MGLIVLVLVLVVVLDFRSFSIRFSLFTGVGRSEATSVVSPVFEDEEEDEEEDDWFTGAIPAGDAQESVVRAPAG